MRMKKCILKKVCFLFLTLSFLLSFTSCSNKPTDVTQVDKYPTIYPDYIGVTIPAEIAPLNFNFTDETIDCIDVVVKGSNGGEIHANGKWADFDIDEWHELTEQNRGGKLAFTVCIQKGERWTQYKVFDIFVSADRLDEWGLTYRLIKPGYENGGDIGMYQRDISTFDEYAMVKETVVPGYCMNCHTANRTNPNLVTMQVRGEGGGTMLLKDGKQEWLNTKTAETKAAGSYSYWHPDGNYCALSVSSVHQAFFTGNGQRIEVFHTFSDVEVLDIRTNELILSPLLRTDDLEIFPAFSPDGKCLYYSTSKPCNVPYEYEKVKCSLCRIAFDAEKGMFGEQVDTLLNGPATGKSYILVRPSYDGRWLMYTVSGRGNFPVCQDDADLWLMDLKTNECKELTMLNSKWAESFHNWSDNSRWFVYSSKREDGMYAQLYIASIDAQGNVTKPFLLPQHNPREFYRAMMHSYNVPDFTKTKVDIDAHEFRTKLLDTKRLNVSIKETL